MAQDVWQVVSDMDTYRSLHNPNVHPREFLDLADLFRHGKPIGKAWRPPELRLYDEAGEDLKPMGHFPGFAGFFTIDAEALGILYPLAAPTLVEVLPLPATLEGLSVLNIHMLHCIDHSRSVFEYFSSGRIMRVHKYAFLPERLYGKHLFRLQEESFVKVFADNVFKTAVEDNELHGLLFRTLDQV